VVTEMGGEYAGGGYAKKGAYIAIKKNSKAFIYPRIFVGYGWKIARKRSSFRCTQILRKIYWYRCCSTYFLLLIEDNDDCRGISSDSGILSSKKPQKREGEREMKKISGSIKNKELRIKLGRKIIFRIDLDSLVFLIIGFILVIIMLTGKFPHW
jgi:hypothetical protein